MRFSIETESWGRVVARVAAMAMLRRVSKCIMVNGEVFVVRNFCFVRRTRMSEFEFVGKGKRKRVEDARESVL